MRFSFIWRTDFARYQQEDFYFYLHSFKRPGLAKKRKETPPPPHLLTTMNNVCPFQKTKTLKD